LRLSPDDDSRLVTAASISQGKNLKSKSKMIRLATPADAAAMIPIINAAFAVEGFIDGTRTDAERLALMFDTGDFLVAEEEGRLVGSIYTEIRPEQRGYIGMLAVDPSQQRRGLGRRMMEAAEEHCRQKGCDVIDILVVNLRTELPPLYRKLGYVEVGIEEFHPSRPLQAGVEAHCIVMSKAL
jgi:ribosomal protein S18 acetylase RimI-like enzyme